MRSKKKIGNTTFIVNSFFPQTGNQTIASKLENLIKADIQKLKNIQDEVESFLEDHIGENMDGHYLDGHINYEVDLIDKNVDVSIHYDAYNHKEWDNGDYLTPRSDSGYIDTEYTVTVFDECGNEEFEFNGNFQI